MRNSSGKVRLVIAAAIAIYSLFMYYNSTQYNGVTGEKQHVGNISADQEIALGLQAAPEMEQQYGGDSNDPEATARVQRIGQELVEKADAGKTPYKFQFHLLADPQTINAFALPGGQVFITTGLYKRLQTDGQLAGVLGHEMGHVAARHGAQQIAKQQLTQGISGAAVMASYDPNHPTKSVGASAMIALIGNLVNLKYSRFDESQADQLGVRFEAQVGYDPHAMIGVMEILKKAAGSGSQPEFFSTHPNPDHREELIKQDIQKEFPTGVPPGLKP